MAKKNKKENSSSAKPVEKMVSENRKANFRYEIMEKLECGMILQGSEVKSLREGRASIEEGYARFKGTELWLVNCDIPEDKQASIWNHDPKRPRKLIAHAQQLRRLAAKSQDKGLTIVPLRLFFNKRGFAKIVIAICRGKKLHDKRESIKKADAKRRIERTIRRK